MIKVSNLTITYNGQTEPAVQNISFKAEEGEIIALTGPNGGGKTTVLRAIAGLIPTFYNAIIKGEVSVNGCSPINCDVRNFLYYVSQDPKTQVVGPTVLLDIALPLILRGADRKTIIEKATMAARIYGLDNYLNHHVHMISSGMLQRTALASTRTLNIKYLLLDEPTSYLDQEARKELVKIVRQLRDENITIIIATHDEQLLKIADRVYFVNKTLEEWNNSVEKIDYSRDNIGKTGSCTHKVLLDKIYAKYPGQREFVLNNITIKACNGKITLLKGPNGSGKTTILYVISGFLKPDKGKVIVDGNVRLLPADPFLVFSRGTLREMLDDTSHIPSFALPILDSPLFSLSGGQLRLAALAVILSSGGNILLLDEPTGGLDPENKRLVIEALLELVDRDYTIIVASHDEIFERIADVVYEVKRGRVESCYGSC